MIKSVTISAVSVAAMLLTFFTGVAQAADGAELYKTKTCFTCHGQDGKTPIMAGYPKVAGQDKAYSLQQMKDIKSGARSNGQSAAMKGVMHLENDEEMAALAEYMSTMAP